MSAAAARVAAIVLAAGESKRFGAQKLLALLEGRPILQHVLDAVNASALDPVVLVVGAKGAELLARVRPGRARVVLNPDYASGQASSLQTGLREVAAVESGAVDAAVVLLGDQPGVTAQVCDGLVVVQRQSRAPAVVSSQRGRRSPPALLHRDIWPEVERMRGDIGAREILGSRSDVVALEIPLSVAALDDVDTPADHQRLTLSGSS